MKNCIFGLVWDKQIETYIAMHG